MFSLEVFKNYCLSKKGVTECFPFDNETLVFKVSTKMFALTNITNPVLEVNLKCEPFMSEDLRRNYDAIKPGYHMNKKHWNTIVIDGSIPDEKILFLVDLSYELVYKRLTRSEKEALEN
ncbi:MmcQ/YjbR family DNA-binding protein [Clostridium sp.]|uniref:MmcQ/YjbR family DNA-binding protein n=1 Tax=Clostridium sp. TaxID=1506 RepID=UPI001A40295A|nr:MmcQ/YjbR family DNA-binding protein [Clostridium sp.]MBK5236699.1 MmcQ/YjbR family DNA-binding protein [Clostridium sp.]